MALKATPDVDIVELLATVIPREKIFKLAEELGVQKRERKKDVVQLVVALILAGGKHRFGLQKSALKSYMEATGVPVVEGSYFEWFDEQLAALMESLAGEAVRWVLTRPVHLPSILSGVSDWRVIDSETVKLDKRLISTWRGTGDYAALKVHKEYSLGRENAVGWRVSGADEHDAREFRVGPERSGQGLIVDLGYVSHKLIEDCREHGVRYVIRVKDGWRFWLSGTATDAERKRWIDSGELGDTFSSSDLMAMGDSVVDVDVTVGGPDSMLPSRLVVFDTPQGRVMFLTNLPRSTHTYAEVGLIYRLRWSIEVDNKIDKSAFELEEIDARKPASVRIVLHARLIATLLANAIVHEDHLRRGLVGDRRRAIDEAPVHPLQVAASLAHFGVLFGGAVASADETELRRLHRIVLRVSVDRSWRRTPSAMDVVKGRTPSLINTHDYGVNAKSAVQAMIGRISMNTTNRKNAAAK